MRYTQTREVSAEVLRAALTFMTQQPAALYPPNYTIWYEHVAAMNPELSRALEERLTAGAALTDSDVARLHAQHVLARDAAAFERLEERFRVLVEEVSNATANAGADASRFGHSLEEHTARLRRPMASELLRNVVAELLADTRHMSAVTSELAKQLERSAGEIRVLTERLEQAQSEALRDPLTGLYNRRGFARALEEVARDSTGLSGAALLVIDIDHFKRINDDYGHVLGDKVLRAVAQVLSGLVIRESISSRLGGEEFAVLLPRADAAAALAVAEEIRAAVVKLRVRRRGRGEYVGRVSVSIGVAQAVANDVLEALLERADGALYAAKRAGRNRVELATTNSLAPSRPSD